ncbi:MAG: hypothetical protein KGJ13_04315, partial [Patescibacteria group bacterium]|nr:hypothetical protein [Patescibacteria group bacterium]
MPYAENTSVSVEKSRAEIEGLLRKFWATDNAKTGGGKYPPMRFQYYTDEIGAELTFTLRDKTIRITLPLPDSNAIRFKEKVNGYGRKVKIEPEKGYQLWEQECRVRWRALALSIKSTLTDIEAGIKTFEIAFLA